MILSIGNYDRIKKIDLKFHRNITCGMWILCLHGKHESCATSMLFLDINDQGANDSIRNQEMSDLRSVAKAMWETKGDWQDVPWRCGYFYVSLKQSSEASVKLQTELSPGLSQRSGLTTGAGLPPIPFAVSIAIEMHLWEFFMVEHMCLKYMVPILYYPYNEKYKVKLVHCRSTRG